MTKYDAQSDSKCFFVSDAATDSGLRYNAGSKARDDLDQIFRESDMNALALYPLTLDNDGSHSETRTGLISKVVMNLRMGKIWDRTLRGAGSDIVFFQYPVIAPSAALPLVLMRRQRGDGLRVVFIIHDLVTRGTKPKNSLGISTALWKRQKERALLRLADIVIAHNDRMAGLLIGDFGIDPSRIVSLGIFDYLMESFKREKKRSLESPVIIAGNLSPSKAGFLSYLPKSIDFNLYGAGYSGPDRQNVHYMGKYLPDTLPHNLEGSFGLIWDGPEASKCSGTYGSYLRINNPHKASLYLASELPVIAWNGAAIGEFVNANRLGFTLDSLDDLPAKLKSITRDQYDQMLHNVRLLAPKLRQGYMARHAIQTSIQRIVSTSTDV